MRHCKSCSVGSEALMNYAKAFNQNVFLLTSPVIQHDIVKNKRNKTLTIGWIGFFSAHRESLYRHFFCSLKMLNFPVKLIVLGITKQQHKEELINYYSGNQNIELEIAENIDWFDEIGIYKRIANFDIGITTLLDNELNKAKSAFKLKQYMSCGVPVLGSSLGENVKFLKNGVNGYFCDNDMEFADKITEINELSEDDYFKLSTNAKKTCSKFSIENYCKTLLDFYANQQPNY